MDKALFMARLREVLALGDDSHWTDKGRLLEGTADTVIGNLLTVRSLPVLNNGAVAIASLLPNPQPDRILVLDGLSSEGQMVTIGMAAAADPANTTVNVGPITGIIEFGNGATFSRVEFDVPTGGFAFVNNMVLPRDSGVFVTVPGGTIRVYARNDANQAYPTVAGGHVGPAAGPLVAGDPDQLAIVKAFVTYYQKAGPQNRVTKTVYFGGGNFSTGTTYAIVPFAKRLRVLRDVLTNFATYRVTFLGGGANILGAYTFPFGSPPDFVDIPTICDRFVIAVAAGASAATDVVAMEFELGI